MKKLLLLTSLFMMGACSTAPESSTDTRPYKFTTEDRTSGLEKFKTINNKTEEMLMDTTWESMYKSDVLSTLTPYHSYKTYYKFDPKKGKIRITEMNDSKARTNHSIIDSFCITEDVFGSGNDEVFFAIPQKQPNVRLEYEFSETTMNWYTRIDSGNRLPVLRNAKGENLQIDIKK